MINHQRAVVAAVAATMVAVALPALATAAPAGMPAHPGTRASEVRRVLCPTNALPLAAESVARAADQARIEAPALYPGNGPAVVELAWQAKFRLNVWAGTAFNCSNKVRRRTVVVDLLFPQMLPSESLSKGVVFVSRFPTGYRVWDIAH